MAKLEVTYRRGKPFSREKVTKVVYTDETGKEVTVTNDDILTHCFPLTKDLLVYAADGMSNVSCNGLRAISAFTDTEQN